MIKTFNKQVACEPIVKRTIESEVKGGFATVKNKVELIKLKVIFGTDDYQIDNGDYIYIKGDQVAHPWASAVYTVDGISFILIPLIAVQMVENE
jgi:hypothetical protein